MFKEKPYFIIDEKPGKIAYCACGMSSDMPFCDGTHEGTSFEPYIVDVPKRRRVAVCGCGKSDKMPYCDGKHVFES
jgi:CDGSH-type Zn-finger protein